MNPWSLIVRGLLAFLVGLVFIIWPGATLLLVLILFPFLVVVDGIFAIVIGVKSTQRSGLHYLIPIGVLEIVIGILILFWPSITVVAFAFIMGLWALVVGICEIIVSLADKEMKKGARLPFLLVGIITIILGILILFYPLNTAEVLVWLMGVFFLCYGVLVFFMGYFASVKYYKK